MRRTSNLRFLVLLLVLALSLSLIYSVDADAQVEYYEKDFNWEYKDKYFTWSLSIPKSLYVKYKSVPVSTRRGFGLSGYGFLTTTDDDYLEILANMLQDTAFEEEYGSYDAVSFVLSFVQSLPYTSDSETSGYDEYPRFPLETLVDGGGDCEDTSFLFATLTLIMGYDTVYINPPEHYAVGVWGSDLSAYYYTYNNKTYYYCETTGDGYEIGEIPIEYINQEVAIYDIKISEQYNPKTGKIPIDNILIYLGLILMLLIVIIIIYTVQHSGSTKKIEN